MEIKFSEMTDQQKWQWAKETGDAYYQKCLNKLLEEIKQKRVPLDKGGSRA